MLYCPNFFWNVLQVWMTGKDVYLQMTWVDQTKHEIFCVHIVCNEIQVKVNLVITTFFFYLRFPYRPNFFWFGVVHLIKYLPLFRGEDFHHNNISIESPVTSCNPIQKDVSWPILYQKINYIQFTIKICIKWELHLIKLGQWQSNTHC